MWVATNSVPDMGLPLARWLKTSLHSDVGATNAVALHVHPLSPLQLRGLDIRLYRCMPHHTPVLLHLWGGGARSPAGGEILSRNTPIYIR